MKHLRSIEEIFDYAIERENEANALYKRLAPLVEKAAVQFPPGAPESSCAGPGPDLPRQGRR